MKKCTVAALVLLMAGGAFAQVYKAPLKLVSPRMNGPEVLAVQTRLLELGFSKVGSADGWFGPLTKDAAADFQRFLGLGDTGVVDRPTWDALLTDSKKQGEIESAIKEANAVLALDVVKKSQDIMDRTRKAGMLTGTSQTASS